MYNAATTAPAATQARTAAAIAAASRRARFAAIFGSSTTRLWGFHSYCIKRERQYGHGPVFRLAPGQPWPTHRQQVALARQQARAVCLWCSGPMCSKGFCPCSPAPAHV